MTGIDRSMSTTSGVVSWATDTACTPSGASPTTCMSSAPSMSSHIVLRTNSWSSTTITRITEASHGCGAIVAQSAEAVSRTFGPSP